MRGVPRAVVIAVLAAALVHTARGVLHAHAMLVGSEPAADRVVSASPTRVRLVFSEEIEPSLAAIAVLDGDGHVSRLHISGDPHDVHAIIGEVKPLRTGAYRVNWHVVSVDGHPVGGSFVFWVGAGTATPPPVMADADSTHGAPLGPTVAAAPLVPAIVRGVAVGAAMMLAGLLFFLSSFRRETSPAIAAALVRWLAIVAPLLLAAEFMTWVMNASPDHRLTSNAMTNAVGSNVGRIELWRLGLSLIALWSVWLARRPRLALFFGASVVAISGATGHSVAITPLAAVPARSLHLLAASAWLGGLVWLLACRSVDVSTFAREAFRVSGVALWASLAVALSGVVMAALFLTSLRDLVQSAYGAVLLAKVAGLVVLLAFGAHHRYRALPVLLNAPTTPTPLGITLRRELLTMLVIVVLGGVLAYIPPRGTMAPHSAPGSPIE